MIDGLGAYDNVVNSGLEWLGDVPAHWRVNRAKFFFREVDERSTSGEEELLSVSHKTGVTPRREKNVTMFLAESNAGHKLCRPGDIVVNTMWAWMAALGVSAHEGLVSPSYGVYRARRSGDFLSRYLDELLRTPVYRSEYVVRSTGITSSRLRLYPDAFLKTPILCPPPDEQAAIVRFLDHADRRIRRYIRAKQKLIKLLEEQKQAIIHRAVTRGLDPNVRLKPSGVEWLGAVPEHWDVCTIGSVAESIQTGPFGSQVHASDYVKGGVPLINPSHLVGGKIISDDRVTLSATKAVDLIRHAFKEGDIVVARRGELGRCSVVMAGQAGWLCGTGSLRIRTRRSVFIPTFLALAFSSNGVRETLTLESIGATMANLNASMVSRIRLPCPPVSEQETILKYISEKERSCVAAMHTARREIELLREYRTRLVADVVTGKLDVRAAAAALPDEPEDSERLDDLEEDADPADPDQDAEPDTEDNP